jgi:hypothetical protein
MPERIQLSRRKGWRMPENTVKVDRSTRWGNPFVIGSQVNVGNVSVVCFTRQEAVDAFRGYCEHLIGVRFVADVAAELRGQNLACWCPLDQPCHADVLLELANKEPEW